MMAEVFFNGQFLDAAEAKIDLLSAAALYGRSVFTTIAVYDKKPFLWEKHRRRLRLSSAVVGIDISGLDDGSVYQSVLSTLEQNDIQNGRVRITLFDGSSASLWQESFEKNASLMINAAPFIPLRRDFRLGVSAYTLNTNSPIVGIKTGNYLEELLAISEAKKSGFDEAVKTNERGEITGSCLSNIFWTKDDKLFTPGLTTGCLPGTTREFIQENIDCEEVVVGIEELEQADAIFLTSAGIGVIGVSNFNDRALKTADHAILSLLPKRN